MGVLGQSRDQGAAAVVPTANGPVDKTGFFENVGAGFSQAVSGPHSTRVGEAIYQKRSYDDIIKALAAEGEQGQDTLTITTTPTQVKRPFRNPYVSGPAENLLNPSYNPLTSLYGGGDRSEIDQIWGAVQRVRQRKPDFLKAFPDEAALQALTIKRRQQDQQVAQAVTSRATTGGSIGGFIGGMAGSVASLDPENVVGGGFGTAAGKTIARTVIKRAVEGAGANAAAAMIGVPGQEADAQRLGQEFTTQDAAHQVEQAAGVGAVFGGAHVIVPKVVGKAGEVVSSAADKVAAIPPVRDALVAASIRAGTVQDHSLLGEWTRAHNPGGVIDTSTPDERAAAHTIMRDVATRETSPLHPEHVGPNDARLDAVAHSLGVDLSVPQVPSPAPLQTPTVRDRAASGRKPATYDEAVHQSEGTGKNPDSSADGHFQFTQGTWLEYAPKVADTKGMSKAQILALRHDRPTAERAMQAFTADNAKYLRDRGLEDSPGNLSLAHFLGKSDAAKVLNADPAAPIERVVDPASFKSNRKVLEGKSASEVIAWAHKRIGASVDAPVARADAVPESDPLDEADYLDVPYERATFKPDELPTAETATPIQSEQWNPIHSGELLLWERENGDRVIVDGNKRAAMAQRLYADDPSIRLPTALLREADGISEEMARTVGALKNVNLGKGSLEERAASLADMPEVTDLLRAPEHHREIAAIAQLPYGEFGAVLNGEPAYHGSPNALGISALHPSKGGELGPGVYFSRDRATASGYAIPSGEDAITPHMGILDLDLSKVRIKEIKRNEWLAERAKIMDDLRAANGGEWKGEFYDQAMRQLEDRFKAEGYHGLYDDWRQGIIFPEFADRVGITGRTAKRFLSEGRDEQAIRAGNGDSGPIGEPFGEAGGRDAAAASDEILARSNEPSLYDHAIAARDTAERFSDPVGEAAKAQTDLLDHDLRMDAGTPARGEYDGSLKKTASWVIRNKETGEVVMETFDHRQVEALNTAKYEAVPIGEYLGSINGKETVPASLDLGVATDPALADRQAQETGLKAAAPLQSAAEQQGTMGLSLFDVADQPTFRLSDEGGARSLKDILDEADADEAAAQALRDCLK